MLRIPSAVIRPSHDARAVGPTAINQAKNFTPSSSDVAPLKITARPSSSKTERAFLKKPSSIPKKSCARGKAEESKA